MQPSDYSRTNSFFPLRLPVRRHRGHWHIDSTPPLPRVAEAFQPPSRTFGAAWVDPARRPLPFSLRRYARAPSSHHLRRRLLSILPRRARRIAKRVCTRVTRKSRNAIGRTHTRNTRKRSNTTSPIHAPTKRPGDTAAAAGIYLDGQLQP